MYSAFSRLRRYASVSALAAVVVVFPFALFSVPANGVAPPQLVLSVLVIVYGLLEIPIVISGLIRSASDAYR